VVDGVECECDRIEEERTDWHPIKSEALRLLIGELQDAGYRIAVIDETNLSVLADIGSSRRRIFVGEPVQSESEWWEEHHTQNEKATGSPL
jgi:hypothetical protein